MTNRFLTPFQKFVKIESFSGILLMLATLLALVWANSPFASSYSDLWQYEIGFSSESFSLNKPLILWINDGLMAIFFFLIGLEIKRELLIGELNSIKKAAFPLFAAIGGLGIPVLVFFIFNSNPEASNGWAIPMATDIAFSLAILTLLGKRAPLSLKIFLTAFAIVDDIGAVLVIALFYTAEVQFMYILYSLIPFAILIYMAARGSYNKYIFIPLAALVWFFFLKSGVHPTVAGILLAFTVPIRQKINIPTLLPRLDTIVNKIKAAPELQSPVLSKEQINEIDNLESWTSSVQSPLQHLEHRLHSWVAYFIIPIFALSNAGVAFNSGVPLKIGLVLAIAASLFIGKSIGITIFSYLGIKSGLADLPGDISFKQILGVGFLAGVGFTMSIFIANLSFMDNAQLLDSAKAGILLGSFVSGLVGYLLLYFAGVKKVE